MYSVKYLNFGRIIIIIVHNELDMVKSTGRHELSRICHVHVKTRIKPQDESWNGSSNGHISENSHLITKQGQH